MDRHFITSHTRGYISQNECRAMRRDEGERICRFCKKLLSLSEGERVSVNAVFNTLKKTCSWLLVNRVLF